MSEYYRTVFSATKSGLSGVPLLESVQDALQEWVRGDFGPGEPSSDSPGAWTGGAGELSEIEGRLDGENLAMFRIKWERPDPDDEIGRWRMSVRLATEGDDVEVDIEVQGSESSQPAPRPECVAALPSIPHRILDEFNCRLDGRRMTAAAKRIDDAEASAFVEDDLLNPNRRLPLVVVSQDASARGASADLLQRRLLGLSRVIWYDHNTAWRIARDMPRALRCYDGAVRLYAPGCSEEDVSQQNPYWLLDDALRLQNGGKLWMLLRDECVNRVPRHTRRRLFSSVSDRIEDAEREVELREILELENQKNQREPERAVEIDEDDIGAYVALHDPYTPPNPAYLAHYERWARAFSNQSVMLKSENANLKSEIERLKDIVEAGEQDGFAPTVVPSAAPRDFKTVWEAVAEANKSLDSLRFFPTAFEYARDSQFRRPEAVYSAFEVLNDCANALANGALGQSVTRWLAERGVEYAHGEREKTDQKYRRERTFLNVYMPAHVKIGGNELRIHLIWEESEGKWLIGYVGKHLPTAGYNS